VDHEPKQKTRGVSKILNHNKGISRTCHQSTAAFLFART